MNRTQDRMRNGFRSNSPLLLLGLPTATSVKTLGAEFHRAPAKVYSNMIQTPPSVAARRSNMLALMIAASAAVTAVASFDPVPAGEAPLRILLGNTEVESSPANTDAPAASAEPTAAAVAAVEYSPDFHLCIQQLEEGREFLSGIHSYKAIFHKTERLGGDLGERQDIEITVGHSPNFNIYMRWRNFEKGRQLLFNSQENDGLMIVKKGGGGLLTRMLPAITLDPMGSLAMSESRYPVTQAGILAMAERIIRIRNEEQTRGYPVDCTRLDDQEVDGRNCSAFLFKFHSQETSPVYRTSRILIDSEYHIPVKVVNHTWSANQDSLMEKELDDLTLVEDYEFTAIDFKVHVATEVFSRNNPRYRM